MIVQLLCDGSRVSKPAIRKTRLHIIAYPKPGPSAFAGINWIWPERGTPRRDSFVAASYTAETYKALWRRTKSVVTRYLTIIINVSIQPAAWYAPRGDRPPVIDKGSAPYRSIDSSTLLAMTAVKREFNETRLSGANNLSKFQILRETRESVRQSGMGNIRFEWSPRGPYCKLKS